MFKHVSGIRMLVGIHKILPVSPAMFSSTARNGDPHSSPPLRPWCCSSGRGCSTKCTSWCCSGRRLRGSCSCCGDDPRAGCPGSSSTTSWTTCGLTHTRMHMACAGIHSIEIYICTFTCHIILRGPPPQHPQRIAAAGGAMCAGCGAAAPVAWLPQQPAASAPPPPPPGRPLACLGLVCRWPVSGPQHRRLHIGIYMPHYHVRTATAACTGGCCCWCSYGCRLWRSSWCCGAARQTGASTGTWSSRHDSC